MNIVQTISTLQTLRKACLENVPIILVLNSSSVLGLETDCKSSTAKTMCNNIPVFLHYSKSYLRRKLEPSLKLLTKK